MHKLLIGALALSLLGASAALADPMGQDQGRHDQGGYQGGHDQGAGDRHDAGDRGDHGRGRHMTCSWRHHHRVCWRTHGY
ncbi:MAG TPA: hypothetical protein VN814_10260 [Caulobacteraceae bacterium]|nr:hypothetical protein [Caulobacteraceae bacterium]